MVSSLIFLSETPDILFYLFCAETSDLNVEPVFHREEADIPVSSENGTYHWVTAAFKSLLGHEVSVT